MAVTNDLDMTLARAMQFTFKCGCFDNRTFYTPDQDAVLIQYSTTGGVIWWTFYEITYDEECSNTQ